MPANPRPALRRITQCSARVLFRTQHLSPDDLDTNDDLKRWVLQDLSEVARAEAHLSPAVKALRPEAPWLEFAFLDRPLSNYDCAHRSSESLLAPIRDHLQKLGDTAAEITEELDSQGLPAPRPTAAPLAVYQLRLTFADIEPRIWRRLLVGNDITLQRLHSIIQAVGGWQDCHLHEFVIAGTRYGQAHPEWELPQQRDATAPLSTLPLAEGRTFPYVYDFGDHWKIEILLERVLPLDRERAYPLCLDGARAFPPEDSGGIYGYGLLIEALADPQQREHTERRNCAGEDYDPERFDLKETNERLRLPK
jgi:hypothetical protein